MHPTELATCLRANQSIGEKILRVDVRNRNVGSSPAALSWLSKLSSPLEKIAKVRHSYRKRESAVMKKDPGPLEALKEEIEE